MRNGCENLVFDEIDIKGHKNDPQENIPYE